MDVYDGFKSMVGGMNGGVIPSVLPDAQYAKGINITCRGGSIKTRPGVDQVTMEFPNDGSIDVFFDGKFQGCHVYHSKYDDFIAFAVSGHVFLYSLSTRKVSHITSIVRRLDQFVDRIHFEQAEQFLVVQDGANMPILIDHLQARVSNYVDNEVPVGTIMAYGHGRLFVKTGITTFMAGDIYSPSEPDSVLTFTECTTNEGSFSIPGSLGEITSMRFVQDFETGTGNGPLVVGCTNGANSYDVFTPRSYWKTQEIGKVQFRGNGFVGNDAVIVVNEDLMYRSWRGLRSYSLSRQEMKQKNRVTDLSNELAPFEDQETDWMRCLSSFATFDGRLLFTMVGEISKCSNLEGNEIDDFVFKGLGVFDMSVTNGAQTAGDNWSVAFDGIWTGFRPTAVVSGIFWDIERCFVFAKDGDGKNVLYELGKKPGMDCENPINCRLYTRAMPFVDYSGTSPSSALNSLKRLAGAFLWPYRYQGDVPVVLWGNPDNRGSFAKLAEILLRCPVRRGVGLPDDVSTGLPHGRGKTAFPFVDDVVTDSVLHELMLSGYEHQFCLEWTGILELSKFSLSAQATSGNPDQPFMFEENMLTELPRDDFDYRTNCIAKMIIEGDGGSIANSVRVHVPAGQTATISTPAGYVWVDSDTGEVLTDAGVTELDEGDYNLTLTPDVETNDLYQNPGSLGSGSSQSSPKGWDELLNRLKNWPTTNPTQYPYTPIVTRPDGTEEKLEPVLAQEPIPDGCTMWLSMPTSAEAGSSFSITAYAYKTVNGKVTPNMTYTADQLQLSFDNNDGVGFTTPVQNSRGKWANGMTSISAMFTGGTKCTTIGTVRVKSLIDGCEGNLSMNALNNNTGTDEIAASGDLNFVFGAMTDDPKSLDVAVTTQKPCDVDISGVASGGASFVNMITLVTNPASISASVPGNIHVTASPANGSQSGNILANSDYNTVTLPCNIIVGSTLVAVSSFSIACPITITSSGVYNSYPAGGSLVGQAMSITGGCGSGYTNNGGGSYSMSGTRTATSGQIAMFNSIWSGIGGWGNWNGSVACGAGTLTYSGTVPGGKTLVGVRVEGYIHSKNPSHSNNGYTAGVGFTSGSNSNFNMNFSTTNASGTISIGSAPAASYMRAYPYSAGDWGYTHCPGEFTPIIGYCGSMTGVVVTAVKLICV